MTESFGLAAFRSRTQVLRMEDALHRACGKYQTRFRRVADAADKPLSDYTETEKIALWKQAKNESSSLTR